LPDMGFCGRISNLMLFHNFRFNHYRFHFSPLENLRMPKYNKGNTIRGGFGTILRRIACVHQNIECDNCDLRFSCPYTRIFNPFIPPEAERLRKNLNIQRPFVVKPPLETKTSYGPYEPLIFEIILVGDAQEYIPYIIVTFKELAEHGFGLNRAQCRLSQIEAVKIDGTTTSIYESKNNTVISSQSSITWTDVTAAYKDIQKSRELCITFLTPTTLKANGRLSFVPQFHVLLKRLRDRLNALSYFYCGETIDIDFKALGEQAEKIKETFIRSTWEERSRSTRRRTKHDLSGFVGTVTYRGNFKPFMPFLLLGQYVHVGKGTVFGNGWYKVEGVG